MSYERTYSHFRKPMRRIVEAIHGELGHGEVYEEKTDEYGWRLVTQEGEAGADLSLMLADAQEYEGEDGKGLGNFILTGCKYGGRILIDYVPYNFTPQVWVKLSPSGWPELQERLDFIGTGIVPIADELRPYCK